METPARGSGSRFPVERPGSPVRRFRTGRRQTPAALRTSGTSRDSSGLDAPSTIRRSLSLRDPRRTSRSRRPPGRSAPRTNRDLPGRHLRELVCQRREHLAGRVQLRTGKRRESPSDGRFDRARRGEVESLPPPGHLEHRPPPVTVVRPPGQEAALLESIEDSGQRARVKVEHRRELSREDSRIPADDPNHEPLRARQPDRRPHPFRPGLEAVIEGPDEAKELQGLPEAERVEIDPGGIPRRLRQVRPAGRAGAGPRHRPSRCCRLTPRALAHDGEYRPGRYRLTTKDLVPGAGQTSAWRTRTAPVGTVSLPGAFRAGRPARLVRRSPRRGRARGGASGT